MHQPSRHVVGVECILAGLADPDGFLLRRRARGPEHNPGDLGRAAEATELRAA